MPAASTVPTPSPAPTHGAREPEARGRRHSSADPAPKSECKRHLGYGVPDETREACRDFAALAEPAPACDHGIHGCIASNPHEREDCYGDDGPAPVCSTCGGSGMARDPWLGLGPCPSCGTGRGGA